jgi:hypothetical protein
MVKVDVKVKGDKHLGMEGVYYTSAFIGSHSRVTIAFAGGCSTPMEFEARSHTRPPHVTHKTLQVLQMLFHDHE